MKTLNETLQRLHELKSRGYIRTHRRGQTGIGKTLEDLLEIKENNIAIANTTFAEFKSARKGSQSMLTLFTKSPLPPKANTELLDRFGYVTPQSKGKKILHTTVKATEYNMLKGEVGFKIDVKKDKLSLVSTGGEEFGYWDESTLKESFENKLHHVLYVFWFNEAWLLSGFDFNGFMNAVRSGVICIDTRIGQYPDGTTHDHGTGFRVFPDKLNLCFSQRQKLL